VVDAAMIRGREEAKKRVGEIKRRKSTQKIGGQDQFHQSFISSE